MNDETKYMLKQLAFYTFIFVVVAWIVVPLIVATLYAFAAPKDYYDPNKVIQLHCFLLPPMHQDE